MADLIQDTIVWANQHGIPTPGFTADGQTTVEATAREIIAAEDAFLAQFGKLVQARAQGVLLRKDFDRYDRAREQLYQSQLRFYNEITSGRVWQALNAVGAVRDVPHPQKAPAASTMLGTMPLNGLSGYGRHSLGALPVAAPLAGVGWGAVILGVVLIVGAVAITAVALASAFEARVNSQQHLGELNRRLEVYNECMQAGGAREDCALTAAAVVPPIPPPPGSEDPMWVHRLKKTAIYSGVALGVLAVGYLAVKYAGKRIDDGPALRGLPSGSFAGARFPVQRASTRRTSRGRNLSGRGTKRGKRGLRGGDYNMEVQ